MAQAYGDISPADAGDRLLRRVAGVLAGTALIMAAPVLWFFDSIDVLAGWVSFALSIGFLFAGLVLIAPKRRSERAAGEPLRVDLDAEARVLSIIETSRDGRSNVSARYGFDGIGQMRIVDRCFIALSKDGRVLARIPLPNTVIEQRLQSALRDL